MFDYDCRIQYKNNCWYLIVPIKVKQSQKRGEKYSMAALDPGVRTFQTLYSTKEVVKIQQDTDLLDKMRKKLDFFNLFEVKNLFQKVIILDV